MSETGKTMAAMPGVEGSARDAQNNPRDAGATINEEELSNAAKLKARLDRLEDMYFRPGAYETKIAQWEVKELRQHRPHLWVDGEIEEHPTSNIQHPTSNGESRLESGAPVMTIPKVMGSAQALAGLLQKYFAGRLSITISKQAIHNWQKGERLGSVLVNKVKTVPPPFPAPDTNGRFQTQECIDWIERWMMPQKGVRTEAGVQMSEGGPVNHVEFVEQKIRNKLEREEAIALGKFKPVEVFNNHLTSFGLIVNNAITAGEKTVVKDILAKVQGPSSFAKASEDGQSRVHSPEPETLNIQVIEEAIREGVRAAMDNLRAAVAKALTDAKEPEFLTTDEK